MNCPTCGAQNDPDARFCAECGTPLENPNVEATNFGQKYEIPDEPYEPYDNDMTIMSTSARLVEEAKTLAVDQDAMAAAMGEPTRPPGSLTDSARAAIRPSMPPEADVPAPARPSRPMPLESLEPSSSPPPTGGQAQSGGGNTKKILMTVGGILLFILILCCCCSMIMVGSVLSDPAALEDIMREIGSLGQQSSSLLI